MVREWKIMEKIPTLAALTVLAVFNNTKCLQDCVNDGFMNNVFNDKTLYNYFLIHLDIIYNFEQHQEFCPSKSIITLLIIV